MQRATLVFWWGEVQLDCLVRNGCCHEDMFESFSTVLSLPVNLSYVLSRMSQAVAYFFLSGILIGCWFLPPAALNNNNNKQVFGV